MHFKFGQKIIDKIRRKNKYISKDGILVNKVGHNNFVLIKENGKKIYNPYIEGLNVEFNGNNSTVEIYEPYKFYNCHFNIGTNNFVSVGKNKLYGIHNFDVTYTMREGSKLIIGEDFTCAGAKLYLHDEPNTTIKIGNDCQFSFDIIIWPSDGHSIMDINGNYLNKGEDITIGNHVWICLGVKVLKGSKIPDNSIVGACAIYTKNSYKPLQDKKEGENLSGQIFAVMPAKSVKNNIIWNRKNWYDLEMQRITKDDKKTILY